MGKSFPCNLGEYSVNRVCTTCPAGKACSGSSSSDVSNGNYSPVGYNVAFGCVDFVKCGKDGVTLTPCN